MFGEWTETDRLPHLIMKYQPCGNEAKDDPSKTSRLLMGPEQVTRPKTLQAYDDDDDDNLVYFVRGCM